jgi:exosortase F-associated protein
VNKIFLTRSIIGMASVIGLALVFIFQKSDASEFLGWEFKPIGRFIINRSVRFLLNDIFAIGLIYALFREKKYIFFSLAVQAIGLVLFLMPYFILKVNFPSYNGPLINYLHRLILNPTLLLLLIPAFYYQRMKSGGNNPGADK